MTKTLRLLAMVVAGGGAAGILPIAGDGRAAEEAATTTINVKDGYDPVASFTDGRPTPGKDEFTVEHAGAVYRFADAANRDAFLADPDRHAPQYGGYCAFGTAMGRKFDGDPHARSIVGGELYLNLDRKVRERWQENPEGFIRGADHHWNIIADIPDAALAADAPAGLSLGAR